MTAKSASSIPHDHRLISCYEAAKLLGCTPQTIYNWIKKGKLKGHKIDNHIFVGKKAIVVLFDTAAAVARMKESLKLHKKELKAEIKNRDKAIIAELREENEMLRSKTDNLTEQVENLREKVKELTTTRKIQNTPFEMDVTRLGLNPRTLLFLDEIGCKNLADLVCLNRGVFIKSRKAGVNTLKQVERKLEGMGLRLGMDLKNMSVSDFNNHVVLLAKLTESTDHDVEAIIETECELRERVSKLENLLSETRNQLYKKNSKIESLEKNLKIAKEKNASQKGSLLALRKASSNSKQLKAEIESLNKKLQSRDKRGYAIFEHKEATLKTWIKGLEEDLASKREHIKSLEIAQKDLREENEKLKEQCTRGDSSQ